MAFAGSRVAVLPSLVLMLAAGVVVPLGIDVATAPRTPRAAALLAFSAVAGVLGWLWPPGSTWAIAFAAVHALACVVIGVFGGLRLLRLARAPALVRLPEAVTAFGLLLLPVGGAWLMASRIGMPLLGFQEPVVTFTAAHFHYAGVGAPLVLGAAGERVLEGAAPGRLYRIAAAAVCAGIPLTALGIATTPAIEKAAAFLLATGMLAASVFLLTAARRRAEGVARLLFCVSGATLPVTMALAATFALGSSAGRGSTFEGHVSLDTMIAFHGAANAAGFVLAGLLALSLTPPRPR